MRNWNSLRNKMEQASYTVEAALIMPIILFVILALCYMAFYQHDKIRIQSMLNSDVLKENMYMKHESDLVTGQIAYKRIGERGIFYGIQNHKEEASQLEAYIRGQLKDGLYIASIETVQVQADGFHIQVQVTSGIHFPFHTVRSYFSGQVKMKHTVCITPHNPAEFTRAYTAVEAVASETKGYQKIKDKLSDMMKILK